MLLQRGRCRIASAAFVWVIPQASSRERPPAAARPLRLGLVPLARTRGKPRDLPQNGMLPRRGFEGMLIRFAASPPRTALPQRCGMRYPKIYNCMETTCIAPSV
jgi:hypothetical protein